MANETPDIVNVVKGGYCVGCGACAAASGKFGMALNEDGALAPDSRADDGVLAAVSAVCPFSAAGPDEDEIGQDLYGQSGLHHTALGYFCATYAGYVAEQDFRGKGSSGGMGSWLLTEALRTGLVDTVLHVRATDPDAHDGRLFAYCTATSEDEIRQGGKSRYYPITMDEMLRYVMDNPGRYAISGVPCFIKAVRRMAALKPAINERIVLTVGLICGHLKTTGFGESLAWQAGVEPANIAAIDFRHKLDHGPASKYAFMVRPKDGSDDVVVPMAGLLGRDWGMSFFKLNACEFCDDVTAETADVSIGDAWLPEYKGDSQGTNVVVVRNPTINAMIEKAIEDRRLTLSPIDPERVALSQDAGLRHRREGLSYRLWLKDRRKEWRPEKRVKPKARMPLLRKLVLVLRYRMMNESIAAFRAAKEKGDLSVFLRRMNMKAKIYRAVYIYIRVVGILEKKIKQALHTGALILLCALFSARLSWAAPPAGEDLYVQIRTPTVTTEDLDRIAAAGFAGVRLSILWYNVEKKTGIYKYDKPIYKAKDGTESLSYEQLVAELAARDLKALVLLYGGNPLYTGLWQDFAPPKKTLLEKDGTRRLLLPPDDAQDIKAFTTFAAHTAAYFSNKYGADRFVWTIWNEPNLWIFYPPEPDPVAFAGLLTQSCAAIKRAVPGAAVAGPGFSTDPKTWWGTDLAYMKEMLGTSNALGCLDALTFHPYRPVNPETVAETYTEIREAMAPFQPEGRTVPIAVDEWGYSVRGAPLMSVDAEKQGVYLTRAYLMNQLSGVPFTNIYEWRNKGKDPGERGHNFGLVTYDGKPKPGFEAFARLLKDLKGYTLLERLKPEKCGDDAYILLYGKGNDLKIAAWRVSGSAKLTVADSAPVTLEDAVRVFPVADENTVRCER